MTTQIQQRMPTAPLPLAPNGVAGAKAPKTGRKRSSLVSWLVFLVGIVVCAIVIGVIAAALGRAAMAVTEARGLLSGFESDAATAQVAYTDAAAAEQAAAAAIEQRKQEVVAEQAAQPQQGTSFELLGESSPAFAQVRQMQDSMAANETPAREAAAQQLADKQAAVTTGQADVVAKQAQVDAARGPLWIASIASGALLLILLAIALLRTRMVRARAKA